MNIKKLLITSSLSLVLMLIVGQKPAYADFCGPGNSTQYKKVYCQMHRNENGDANSEIITLISTQFKLEEDMVNQILDGTVCDNVAKMDEEAQKKVPEKVRIACTSEKVAVEQRLFAQNLFQDVRNSFQKEKAMFFNKMALKMKFQASEQYWDGKVTGLDAPFDLMTDLNLIDIVLFGSKAQWNGDVYNFPEKDGGEEDPKEENNNEPEVNQNDAEIQKDLQKEEEAAVECVSPEDPDADPNAIVQAPLCGNGSLDILLGEQCDDGNKESGDGCNQFCMLENSGANNLCQDPEVVTFNQDTETAKALEEAKNLCPPGYVPKKKDGLAFQDAVQAEGYPGPSIGGTLKQFPASERPICGPGKSPVEITVAGKKEIAVDDNGEPRCLSTSFCSDPDVVRTFLAASAFPFPIGSVAAAEWQTLPEEHPVRKSLEAIEVAACVNVIKENRPTTYYNPNEGCVDCHIRAMVDALEETLTTNVTPLSNPTKAFGLSSRFGPNMSFNLITTLKPKLKFTETNTAPKAVDKSKDAIEKMLEEILKPTPTIPPSGTDFDALKIATETEKDMIQTIDKDLQAYNRSGGAIGEIELISRVDPLIGQMRVSFESLQSMYQEMVDTTNLDKKNQCT